MKRGKRHKGETDVVEAVKEVAVETDDRGTGPETSMPRSDEASSADGAQAGAATEPKNGGAESQEPTDLESLQRRIAALEDNLLRAKADYQNLQRRTAVELSEAVRYANAELMRSILGVLDDFERALASAQDTENLQAVVDGVRLVHQNLVKSLTDAGLEPIDARHKPFDPAIHEAMMQQPSDEYPPGTVLEQVAKGYKLRDRVLRPAKVIVAKAAE